MPVLDGIGATKRIRSDDRFADLPIIAATAHAMTSEVERCLAAGMNGHVAKPISEEKLYEALSAARLARVGTTLLAPVRVEAAAGDDVQAEDTWEKTGENAGGYEPFDKMVQLLGAPDVAAKLFNEFCRQNAGAVSELRAYLEAGDTVAAARQAHQVKGVAGNLGLMALSAASDDLEQCLRDADDSGPSIANAQQKYEQEIRVTLGDVRNHLRVAGLLEADLAEG